MILIIIALYTLPVIISLVLLALKMNSNNSSANNSNNIDSDIVVGGIVNYGKNPTFKDNNNRVNYIGEKTKKAEKKSLKREVLVLILGEIIAGLVHFSINAFVITRVSE